MRCPKLLSISCIQLLCNLLQEMKISVLFLKKTPRKIKVLIWVLFGIVM